MRSMVGGQRMETIPVKSSVIDGDDSVTIGAVSPAAFASLVGDGGLPLLSILSRP